MQEAGRLETCKQAVINLSEDCLWNLLSSCSNVGEISSLLRIRTPLCGMTLYTISYLRTQVADLELLPL